MRYRISALLVGMIAIFFFPGCNDELKKEEIDQFSINIRTTEALSPEDEKKGFKLPPGFEIQLFASEPEIGKPINMSFDARGRLWVTQSYEYPFPDSTGVGKDKITILEDTDGDGSADTFTDFADSLNIPIGIIPVKDGAVAYSIPNVYHFIDKDGDDRVDERKVILSGFQFKDTHGMINNLFRGLDGWIHGSHGYANNSSVTDRKGKVLEMNSGNTFRFKEDGSDIEFTTTGRVNTFGYAYDEKGYLYSVDCHTSPIYQLIRGADYPHFAKQATGIGFGPHTVIKNQHGATALAGLEYYIDSKFPEVYQNSFYYGDVVKSKVYRSTKEMNGTTAYITQEEDFIDSADPWFRPVDVKLGPDGALYIADFYNRIIGHYEVPLDHPGRDRERGRIWRIVYKGDGVKAESKKTDWSKSNLSQLIEGLGHSNLPLRSIVADQIIDRFGDSAIEPLIQTLQSSNKAKQQIQILWILYRMDKLSDELLVRASNNSDVNLRVHALRVMFEKDNISNSLREMAKKRLRDEHPDIVRAAIMALSKHPYSDQLIELLSIQERIPEHDTHLRYVIRQCLRDHLRNDDVFRYVKNRTWKPNEIQSLVDVSMGVESPQAAIFLLKYLESRDSLNADALLTITSHASRYISFKDLDRLVRISKNLSINDLDLQFTIYKSILGGIERSGVKESKVLREWAISIAGVFLNQKEWTSNKWKTVPFDKSVYRKNTWQFMDVPAEGGLPATRVLASGYYRTEVNMGKMFSLDFEIPAVLSFQLFGNKRKGDNPKVNTNVVQLRLSESDEIVQEVYIDSNSMRKEVKWNNTAYKEKQGYLIIIDGSASVSRYVGIGALDPSIVRFPSISPEITSERQIFAAKVVEDYKLIDMETEMEEILFSEVSDIHTKIAAAKAILSIDDQNLAVVQQILQDDKTAPFLAKSLATILGKIKSEKAISILRKSFSSRHYSVQKQIAEALAQSNQGINQLLEAATNLEVAPRVLLERQVNEYLVSTASKLQIKEFESLTKGIKKPREKIQELIDQRLGAYQASMVSNTGGREVFISNCSACHQIKGVGGSIGPQLDGIGNWGAVALTEKILDPNRNISKAFISYNIKLKDGTIQTGLLKSEEGELFVFADATGQEFTVAKKEILEKKASPFTLMPDHFGEVIEEEEYYSLLNFLLKEK